jgi:hypothetical protein
VTIARSEVHSNRTSPQWHPPVNVLLAFDMTRLPKTSVLRNESAQKKTQAAMVAALSGKFAAFCGEGAYAS